ncbi:MAG: nucleotidyltransferase family protein [Chloroflexi bacterium]|nr:MAG: nucleotidyltransferase family protein [Chloroflexota bacterium]
MAPGSPCSHGRDPGSICASWRPVASGTAYYNCTIAKRDILSVKRREAAADQAFTNVLRDAVQAISQAGYPFLVLGGLASALVGRPRWTHDIDVLVRPDDARDILEVFARAGFTTEETDPVWIYKAFKDDVMVDVIFMVMGGIYLDDQMQSRSIEREYEGLRLRIPSPEDQIVIKGIVHREETSRHWFDALAILGRAELDWEYLLRRGRVGARRILALLIYAQSSDILVPDWVIRRLYDEIYAQ